ncbi:MAG TPA: hypothetical protein VI382_09885, partial [Candidatus Manganitrophaceae bacterium]|nr:hypothetical protein [Candidatus Manganitrophaceae bacterium]
MKMTRGNFKTFFQAGFLFLLACFLGGCGDSNFFESLADDNSLEARREKAQQALDKGDCDTAVALFTDIQQGDPTNVDRRLDLSAAYLCRAGFSVPGLIRVAADFDPAAGGVNGVFQKITAQVSTLIPDT